MDVVSNRKDTIENTHGLDAVKNPTIQCPTCGTNILLIIKTIAHVNIKWEVCNDIVRK